jgi:hypothetical protein
MSSMGNSRGSREVFWIVPIVLISASALWALRQCLVLSLDSRREAIQ